MNIELIPYNAAWPQAFEERARVICGLLGIAAFQLEHVGSTAVPQMSAKPIIDILLIVENSADERSYLPQLQSAGYQMRVREPEFHEHRMLRSAEGDVHLHVFSRGSQEASRMVRFRDRLRKNAENRKRYERVKRRLASMPWPSQDAYAQAKSQIVEEIIATEETSG